MTSLVDDPDGAVLLTSPQVADLLSAAVAHGGGSLVSWRLEHVDANPRHSTTATYLATVDWPFGRREELFGASIRVDGPGSGDEQAVIFADGVRQVAVWLYPRDPELPGLVQAAFTEGVATLLTDHNVLGVPVTSGQVRLEMIGYRPRRRAVLRVVVTTRAGERNLFIKVMRTKAIAETVRRHLLLAQAGVPAPEILLTTDSLIVLRELPGRPLARAMFDDDSPCTAEQLVGILDAMPADVAQLARRSPWTDAVDRYAAMVEAALPAVAVRLRELVGQIQSGLRGLPAGDEPTHGDFHEGQLFVAHGRICGVLDIDTIGPGRRADDLACLLAHLSTVQRLNAQQAARLGRLITGWLPVFDGRVDPVELRLRAAAVAISLATGPYRGQEPNWEQETVKMVETAEWLVRGVAGRAR